MDHISNESIEQLYRQAFPIVAKAISRSGGDLENAKDIFHDALIIYIEKQRGTSPEINGPATAYIAGIARILWIRRFNERLRQGSAAKAASQASPTQPYPLEETPPPALADYLVAAGKKCLTLLQAFYYEGRSMDEIAEKFNYRTRHSATVQKYKCLEKVREALKKSRVYEKVAA